MANAPPLKVPEHLWTWGAGDTGTWGCGDTGMWGRKDAGHSPLALARMQDELLVAAGAEAQLVLRGVEDVQEQVALPGAAGRDEGGSASPAAERRAALSSLSQEALPT